MSLQEPSLRDIAHPALERLAAATGEKRAALRDLDRRPLSASTRRVVERAPDVRPDRRRAPPLGGLGRQGVPRDDAARARGAAHRTRQGADGGNPYRRSSPRQIATARRLVGRQRRRTSSGRGFRERSRPGPAWRVIAVVSVSGRPSRIRRADAKRYVPAGHAAAAGYRTGARLPGVGFGRGAARAGEDLVEPLQHSSSRWISSARMDALSWSVVRGR
jgi:hypothetical protein